MANAKEVSETVVEFIKKQLARLPQTKSGEPRKMLQWDESLRAPDGSISYVKSGFSRERARTMVEGLSMKLSSVFNEVFDSKKVSSIIEAMVEDGELSTEVHDYRNNRVTYFGLAGTKLTADAGASASEVVRALDL